MCVVFLVEEIHFMEHFPLTLCTIEREEHISTVKLRVLGRFVFKHMQTFSDYLSMKGIFDGYSLWPLGKSWFLNYKHWVILETLRYIWKYIQSLTKAIIFELFYYINGYSRVYLTSMNIYSKCHAYLLY